MTGCSSEKSDISDITQEDIERIRNAPDIDRSSTNTFSYRCFGNAIGKRVNELPGYKPGMSALEVYGLVERIVGKENITPHDSKLEDVDDDWYMVALMTGKDDYHFIVFDHGVVYNKQGNTDFVKGCTIECILSTVWVSHFHEQEQIDQYAQVLENPQLYTDRPVFFSIRRTWDE